MTKLNEYKSLVESKIIKHFKHETLTEEQKQDNLYLYQILAINVTHTETGEKLVVYKALYDGKKYGLDVEYGQVFARPMDMFFLKVDKEKDPNIKQEYRFELYYGGIKGNLESVIGYV